MRRQSSLSTRGSQLHCQHKFNSGIRTSRIYSYNSDKNEYDMEMYFTIGMIDDSWHITDFTKQPGK